VRLVDGDELEISDKDFDSWFDNSQYGDFDFFESYPHPSQLSSLVMRVPEHFYFIDENGKSLIDKNVGTDLYFVFQAMLDGKIYVFEEKMTAYRFDLTSTISATVNKLRKKMKFSKEVSSIKNYITHLPMNEISFKNKLALYLTEFRLIYLTFKLEKNRRSFWKLIRIPYFPLLVYLEWKTKRKRKQLKKDMSK
jgi:hypothetical protein